MRKPGGHTNTALWPDVRDFIVEMNTHGVEYVLVGGYAVGAYGVIRATSDIDFFFRRTSSNVQRLCAALADFGAPATVIDPAHLIAPNTTIQFGIPPERIDLLGTLDGVDFDAVWTGATVLHLDQLPVRLIGLVELRANKAATGRTQDLADLERLPLDLP